MSSAPLPLTPAPARRTIAAASKEANRRRAAQSNPADNPGRGTVTIGRQEEPWTRFASEIGAEFIRGKESRLGPLRWKSGTEEVAAKVDHWIVRLDTYNVSGGESSTKYTRMRASCSPKDWFRFEVYREGLASKVGKLLGMQDIEVGYPEFDRDFIVKGDDESKVRALLANGTVRQLIHAQPSIDLEANEGELRFRERGVITDVERLKSLHRLFAETLTQLSEIGAIW